MIALRITAVAVLLCAAGCTSNDYAASLEPSGEWEPANPGLVPTVGPIVLQPDLVTSRTARRTARLNQDTVRPGIAR